MISFTGSIIYLVLNHLLWATTSAWSFHVKYLPHWYFHKTITSAECSPWVSHVHNGEALAYFSIWMPITQASIQLLAPEPTTQEPLNILFNSPKTQLVHL
jgi:hypothetical protein